MMPLSFSFCPTNCPISCNFFFLGTCPLTSILKFFLSKEEINNLDFFNPNCSSISVLADLSAVAVKAINGTSGNEFLNTFSCVYSGLKSWPHMLTQCASSMATNFMFNFFNHVLLTAINFSGDK